LIQGWVVPGLSVGQPTTVQGLILGFHSRSMNYSEKQVCPPCPWVSEEVVKLADAVLAGLASVANEVSDLGAGEGKPAPFEAGAWGWHVAYCWAQHIRKKNIVFGPMACWQLQDGWHFLRQYDGTVVPRKFAGPGSKTFSRLCQHCALQCQGSITRPMQCHAYLICDAASAWCIFLHKATLVGKRLVLCFQRSGWVPGPRSSGPGPVGLHSAHHALPELPPQMVAQGRCHNAFSQQLAAARGAS
jgi:hypothetical protein